MKRSFRRFFWFFKAFLDKYLKVIIIGLGLGAIGFFFYSRYGHLLPKPHVVNRIGRVGRYTADDLPADILKKLSRGLVKISHDGSPVPDLAESWETLQEGSVYLVSLKKGLFWQDGSPLKAQDINLNLKDIEIEVRDDYLLSFKLKEAFSPFPNLLIQPVFKKGLLGFGPYRLAGIKTSGDFVQSVKLAKKGTTIIYKFYPTEEAAILGFKLGEINQLENITHLYDLKDWPRIKIDPQIAQDQFVAAFFNNTHPLFSQKSFRQALNYAFPKPKGEARALGPISPNSWAFNSQVKPYLYDLDRVKSLLESVKIDETKIELATTFSQLSYAEEIKKAWEAIGLQVEIRVVTSLPQDFQVFLVSQKIPLDADQYTLWHSTQNTNITGYNNPKVDKLLEDGRKIDDQEERKLIYLDFQRFLVEDAPAAFLFHPKVYTISR